MTKIERRSSAHRQLHRRFENYLIGLASLYWEISERPVVAEQFVQETGRFINNLNEHDLVLQEEEAPPWH